MQQLKTVTELEVGHMTKGWMGYFGSVRAWGGVRPTIDGVLAHFTHTSPTGIHEDLSISRGYELGLGRLWVVSDPNLSMHR